jgi:pyruvate carboxylase subunit B
MAKEIKFSLVYRDMWQSAGKYMPRRDQLERIAPVIVDMGCFARVETNGGGFEQIQLLFGENPNKAVRAWTKAFNEAGIQTHMLERGLNGIRMSPCPVDVRKMMFAVKKKQGVDIARSFDGLNDARNIIDSIRYANAGGMIAQATLSLTHSKLHTVEYYLNLAGQLVEAGAQEICLKDMAGVGRPASLGRIVRGIKADHPGVLIQYHGQTAPGFTVASILEVARAGAEIIDVGMEPLAWGTGHADVITVMEMLRDAGFSVPDINMKAYMHARTLSQEFIDDFLGYYISPRNRFITALLIGPGLPGGMMGSLMADLETNLKNLNAWLQKNGRPEMSVDDLLIRLFDEVEYIWPMLGYPPLVTPYSQYVKNVALMNVLQMIKGKERWSMIDDNTWDMLLGKQGVVPGPLAPEIVALAGKLGKEFYTGHPQDLYPDQLPEFRKEMDANGWEYGQDEEELFELAMHPAQYRNYKSGKAREEFEADLAKQRASRQIAPAAAVERAMPATASSPGPKTLRIDVNGQPYIVTVAYADSAPMPAAAVPEAPVAPAPVPGAALKEVISPLEGNFFRTKSASERGIQLGDAIRSGDVIGYIESMKVYNTITADQSGKLVEICFKDGESVPEDAVLIRLQ